MLTTTAGGRWAKRRLSEPNTFSEQADTRPTDFREENTTMRTCLIPLIRTILAAVLAAIGFAVWTSTKATAADVVISFRETDEMFANPGQGWMTTRRMPDGGGRFPYSVAYFRLNWEEIEPAEGQYNWQAIDEPMGAWSKQNVRIAFRIMTTNAHTKGYYCSPKWLFDAGCQVLRIRRRRRRYCRRRGSDHADRTRLRGSHLT